MIKVLHPHCCQTQNLDLRRMEKEEHIPQMVVKKIVIY